MANRNRKSRKGVTLSANAAAFDAALAAAPEVVVETPVVETPVVETVAETPAPEVAVDETVQTPLETVVDVSVVTEDPAVESPAPEHVETWRDSKRGARVTRSGVHAPAVGTKGGDAWDLFDRCYAAGVVDTASIVATGVTEGQNPGQLRTELSTWRRFHGLSRPRRRVTA